MNPPSGSDAYNARWSLALAIILGLLTLWMLLYPFDFQAQMQSRWMSEVRIHRLNFVSNLVLFIPFAAAVGWALGRRGFSVASAVALAVLAGAAISLAGETLQTHLPQRHSSLVDFLCNLLGSAAGGMAAARWSASLDRALTRLRYGVESSPQAQRMTLAVLTLLISKAAPFDVALETRLLRLNLGATWRAGWPWSQTYHWLAGDGAMMKPSWWELAGSGAMLLIWSWAIWSICRALRVRFQRQGDWGSPALPVLIMAMPAAVLLEVMQWFINSRVMDATDLLSAWMGIAVGASLDALAGRIKAVKTAAWGAEYGPRGLGQVVAAESGVPDTVIHAENAGTNRPKADNAVRAAQPGPGDRAAAQEKAGRLDGSHTGRSRGRAIPTAAILAMVLGIVTLMAIAFYFLGQSDAAPYNLRRLLSGGLRGMTAAMVVTGSLAALGGLTAWVGAALARSWRSPRFWLIWIAFLAAGATLMIRLLPRVMVEKVVGSPVWFSGDWSSLETMVRLAGLMLWPAACILPGVMIWRNIRWPLPAGSQGVKELVRSWTAIGPVWIAAVLGVLAGRTMVVTLAGTDNLTELIRGGGDPWQGRIWIAWPGEAYLTLLWLLMGANAGLLARVIGQPGRSFGRWLAGGAVVTIGAAWMGQALVESGTVASLQKYDLEFSAIQFLLGADRATTLDAQQLFIRWTGLWTALVVLLGCGAAVGNALGRMGLSQASGKKLHLSHLDISSGNLTRQAAFRQRATAWIWLALAILAGLLAIYGSLVPFESSGRGTTQAWEQFRRIMTDGWTQSRSDWATNLTLFGGLAFIWITAAERWINRRSLLMALGTMIWLGILLLAASLEFGQLLIKGRSTSPSDVVAAGAGAAAGLLLYFLWGGWWQQVVSRWLEPGPAQLGRLLVNLYLLRYLAWSWLPMDLVMNLQQLQARWQEDGVVLGPGLEAGHSLGKITWDLGMRCLMGVPLGWWLKDQRWTGSGWIGPAAIGLVALGMIELSQVAIKSQIASAVQWLAACVGLVLGVITCARLEQWYEWWLGRSRAWYAMWMVIYGLMLAAMLTWPWDFSPTQLGASGVVERLFAWPLLVLQQSSTSVAIDVLLRRTLMTMPWGPLLVLAVRPSFRWRSALFVSGWAIMTLALVGIEWLRAMSPQRVADSTGLWLGSAGILLGAGIYAWYCPPNIHATKQAPDTAGKQPYRK